MKITYIHHSSFSVEFNHVTMLFDYYEGPLPDFDRSRPLVVFASHFHGDHFAPVIFDLAERIFNMFSPKTLTKRKCRSICLIK